MNCGLELKEGVKFCSNCGLALGKKPIAKTLPQQQYKQQTYESISSRSHSTKKIILGVLAIVIVVIIILVFLFAFSGRLNTNGVFGNDTEKNRFIGQWMNDVTFGGPDSTLNFFYEGGERLFVGAIPANEINDWAVSGSYDIKNGQLVIIDAFKTSHFSYSFSNFDKTLTLTNLKDGSFHVYIKQE